VYANMTKTELLERILEKLDEFESCSAYDSSEVEATRDALATAIEAYVNEGRPEDERIEFDSLAEAIHGMGITSATEEEFVSSLQELDDLLETSSYDEAEDHDERIEELKTDLYHLFRPELQKLRNNA